MATYDPKRTRPPVTVGDADPAPVEGLLPAADPADVPMPPADVVPPVIEPEPEPAAESEPAAELAAEPEPEPEPTLAEAEPVRVEVSPSPFEPAGPPDRRAAIVAAVLAAVAVTAGVVVWLRRRTA